MAFEIDETIEGLLSNSANLPILTQIQRPFIRIILFLLIFWIDRDLLTMIFPPVFQIVPDLLKKNRTGRRLVHRGLMNQFIKKFPITEGGKNVQEIDVGYYYLNDHLTVSWLCVFGKPFGVPFLRTVCRFLRLYSLRYVGLRAGGSV